MVFLTRTVGHTVVTPHVRNPRFLNADTDSYGCSLVLAAGMTADQSITIPVVDNSDSSLVLTHASQSLLNKQLDVPTFKEPIMTWLEAVTVATTTQFTGTDIDTQLQAGGIVDGVTLVATDRVLVLQHDDHHQTGIYVVAGSGTPSRSRDLAHGSTVPFGAVVLVRNGATHKNKIFRMEAYNGDPERTLQIGSDLLTWTLINIGADTTTTLTNKTIVAEDNTLHLQWFHTTHTASMVPLNPTPQNGWHVIPCDTTTTTDGLSITLPSAINRVIVTVFDVSGAASALKPITINTQYGEYIGNDQSVDITGPFNSVTLCGGMGTKWIMM